MASIWDTATENEEEELYPEKIEQKQGIESEKDWHGDHTPVSMGSHIRSPQAFQAWATALNLRSTLAYLDLVHKFFKEGGSPPVLFVEGPKVSVSIDKFGNVKPMLTCLVVPEENGNFSDFVSAHKIEDLESPLSRNATKSIFTPFFIKTASGGIEIPVLWPQSYFSGIAEQKNNTVAFSLSYVLGSAPWSLVLPFDVLEELYTYLKVGVSEAQKHALEEANRTILDFQKQKVMKTYGKAQTVATNWGVFLKLLEGTAHTGLLEMDGLLLVQNTFFRVRPKTGLSTIFAKAYDLNVDVVFRKDIKNAEERQAEILSEIERLKSFAIEQLGIIQKAITAADSSVSGIED
ncbi:MAG: hypothetical protein ACYDBP_07180 [Leptospirales bacterium]